MNTTILEYEQTEATAAAADQMETEDAALRRTLTALGMKPFTKASVEKYKRKKRYEESSKLMLFLRATYLDLLLNILTLVVTITMPICALITMGTLIFSHTTSTPVLWTLAGSAVVFGIVLYLDRLIVGEWMEIPWQSFSEPVPPRVRNRVEAVLEKMPELNIYVDKLTMTRDPLVFALSDGKRTYFEVWDEHDFEPQYESQQ